MGANDQEMIKIAREYFMRADQRRPDILELFHEGAEIYFPSAKAVNRSFSRRAMSSLISYATSAMAMSRSFPKRATAGIQRDLHTSMRGMHLSVFKDS